MKTVKNSWGSLVASFMVIGMVATAYASAADDALAIWFRADLGITTNAAGGVTSWANLGTLGSEADIAPAADNSAAHVAYEADGIGGKPSILFDGTVNLETASAIDTGITADGGAWFVVFKTPCTMAERSNMGIFGGDPGSGRFGIFFPNNEGEIIRDYFFSGSCIDYNVYSNQTQIISMHGWKKNSNQKGAVFSKWNISASNYGFSPAEFVLRVGKSISWTPVFKGEIAEIRIYNRALTRKERCRIEFELCSRYGESWAGHGSIDNTALSWYEESDQIGRVTSADEPDEDLSLIVSSGGATLEILTPSAAEGAEGYFSNNRGDGVSRAWYVSAWSAIRESGVKLTFDRSVVGIGANPLLYFKSSYGGAWNKLNIEPVETEDSVSFTIPSGWGNGFYAVLGELDSHLAAWYRADLGISTNELGQVVSWANGGTRGAIFDVAPASGAASASLVLSPEGLGGKPSVTFDGTDYLISASGDAGYTSAGGTWFVVYKPTSSVVNNTALFGLMNPSDSRRIGAFCVSGTVMRGFFLDSGNAFQQPAMYSDAAQNWCLSCFTNSGTTYLAGFVNGGIDGAAKSQSSISPAQAPLKIGQMLSWTGTFSGEIAELRFYNRPLTAVERARVDLEMSARYDLDISRGFGGNATALLAAHGEDVAVAGYAPGQGVGAEVVTSASSGGMTFSFAEAPSADLNSLVAIAHDGGAAKFAYGGDVMERTWCILNATGTRPCRLTFATGNGIGCRYSLLYRAPNAGVFTEIACNEVEGMSEVSFSVDAAATGTYALGQKPTGLILVVY